VQAHLVGSRAIDRARLVDFLRAVHGLGLDIMITSSTSSTTSFPETTRCETSWSFRKPKSSWTAVFDAAQPTGIVTWGSPINILGFRFTISDRTACRIGPLPLDRDMQDKPMYPVVSEFITRCGGDDRN
jgi:endo-1,4-beta-xylanase